MLDKVTIPRFAELSGYTEEAVRAKIERGVWLEGVVWLRAPDNRILISIQGYDAWAEGQAFAPQATSRSRSTSVTKASAAVSDFASHRRRKTSSTPPDSRQP
jgi:hypothetical protein